MVYIHNKSPLHECEDVEDTKLGKYFIIESYVWMTVLVNLLIPSVVRKFTIVT